MKMDKATVATTISTTVAYGSAAGNTAFAAFLDKYSHDEWAAIGIIGGIAFGALTWGANVYFQYRRLRMQEQRLRPPPPKPKHPKP